MKRFTLFSGRNRTGSDDGTSSDVFTSNHSNHSGAGSSAGGGVPPPQSTSSVSNETSRPLFRNFAASETKPGSPRITR